MPVEVECIPSGLRGLLVPECFEGGRRIVDRITRTKVPLKLGQETWIGVKPTWALALVSHGVAKLGLEPFERRTLEVRNGKGDSRFIVRKTLGLSGDVHRALEDEGLQFVGV